MKSAVIGSGAVAIVALVAGFVMSEPAYGLICWIVAGWAAGAALIFWRPMIGAGVTGLGATAVSLYLTFSHYNVTEGAGSICNAGGAFNCDAVNSSEYSELFGVPIALIGAAFYLALSIIAFLSKDKAEPYSRGPALVGAGGLAGVITAVFLMWASTQVGSWCLFCISTYGASALILLAGVLGTRPEGLGAQILPALAGAGKDKSISTALTVGIVALALGIFGYTSRQTAAESVASGEADYSELYAKVPGRMVLRGDEPVWGKPDAPYTLVEFADFECPYCGDVFPEVKALVARNPDLRVVFKNYPLSNTCNAKMAGPMHENACSAAAAALCAEKQGRFWELAGQMFKNQRNLAREDILFMASDVGLDKAALSACMDDPATLTRLSQDIEDGWTAGVASTPTMYLGGVVADTWVHMTTLTEGTELLLRGKAAGEVFTAPTQVEER